MDPQELKKIIEAVVSELTQSGSGDAGWGSSAGANEQTTRPRQYDNGPTPGATVSAGDKGTLKLTETGPMERGTDPKEVVIVLSPAFSTEIFETIIGIPHADVIREICAGIEEEGLNYRIGKHYHSADVAFCAHEAAKLSGSGIGIGIQSRGTSVIHQKDLDPLNNLELFPQAPLIDLDVFRAMGKNAALYAKGESPSPVPTANDQMARPKYQAKAALLHNKETRLTDQKKRTQALKVEFN